MLEKLPHAIGAALASVRPGLDRTVALGSEIADAAELISVASPAFTDRMDIPVRYTEDGEGLSPPLAWTGTPPGTRSVVLLIEDADSPTPAPLVHAILWDLPGQDGGLEEGAIRTDGEDEAGRLGRNSFLRAEYLPPDPPPGHGPHRYVFQVFALDRELSFDAPPGRSGLLAAMKGGVLAKGTLIGTYERD